MHLFNLHIRPCRLGLSFALFLIVYSSGSIAQFVDPDAKTGTSAGASVSGIANQSDNTTDTFEGITVQVQRVVNIPSKDNTLRVLLRIIESEDNGRRIAFIAPQAQLADEFGNIYTLVDSTGVRICGHRKFWDVDLSKCASWAPQIPVKMTPQQPLQVSATFTPGGDNFEPDLAAEALTGALQFRFGLYSSDLSVQAFADVVINGVELPQ